MRIEQIIWSIIGFSTAILFAVILTGCKVQKPIQQKRDSVRVEYRLDSVYVYKHDSVFRDRWRAGDTIYITTEKWRTQYRDKIVERHDTIASVQTEQVEVRYVPDYYRRVSRGFWVLLALAIVFVGFKAYKLYIKVQSGGLF